jgi:hypothetical protein
MKDMSNYTESESVRFTFVGRAESDSAANMLEKLEECLIGLNLEPDAGWAWISEGKAIKGDVLEDLAERLADVVRRFPLPDSARHGLASELGDALAATSPAFDRELFLRAVMTGPYRQAVGDGS